MAITFVGSHVGTHAATSAQTVNFSSLLDSGGAAPTLQQGDIVYVAVENASTLDRSIAGGADIGVPSGYTGLGVHDYRNDSNDSNFRVSRKLMGVTPDTSVAIPPSNATTAGVAYAIYVFRGVNTTTPESPTIVVTGAINTGVANAAAIIPVTAGSWVVVFGGAAVAAGAVFTNPAGFDATTNYFRSATITTTTNDANIGGAIYTGWTTGSYDPAAFGGSTSTNTGSWSAATLALNPIVTHTSTGVLTGPGSTVVGSAEHYDLHTSSGALTGAGSVVVGSAARSGGVVAHDSSGVLGGVSSAIVGSAARTRVHSSTGVLAGQGSLIVGSAARFRTFASSGALTGQGSTVAGVAERTGLPVSHAATGVLVGAGSAIAGSASRAGLESESQRVFGGDVTPWQRQLWKRIEDEPQAEEIVKVIEAVAEQVITEPDTLSQQVQAAKQVRTTLENMGIAYKQAYQEIYLELLAELQQEQEDAQIAAVMAALL